MDKPEIRIVKVPMPDTGLGREAGFRNDAEMIAHAKQEREALDPAVREIVEKIDVEFERRMLVRRAFLMPEPRTYTNKRAYGRLPS